MKTETKIEIVSAVPFAIAAILWMVIIVTGGISSVAITSKLIFLITHHLLENLQVCLVLSFALLYCVIAVVGTRTVWHLPAVNSLSHRIYSAIENWFAHRTHSIVKCTHNGVIGIAPYMDFDRSEGAFRRLVKKRKVTYEEYHLLEVKNVMTFSDREDARGKVTGTLADLAKLEKDCWIGNRTFVVPGSSTRFQDLQPIPFEKGYRLIHGHAPKQ